MFEGRATDRDAGGAETTFFSLNGDPPYDSVCAVGHLRKLREGDGALSRVAGRVLRTGCAGSCDHAGKAAPAEA